MRLCRYFGYFSKNIHYPKWNIKFTSYFPLRHLTFGEVHSGSDACHPKANSCNPLWFTNFEISKMKRF